MTLISWAESFLQAVSNYNQAVSKIDPKAIGYATRFGGRYSPPTNVQNAQQLLFVLSNKLPDILDTPNKQEIVDALKKIISKLPSGVNGGKINSYYKDLSDWYFNYIKPLL